jgi:hypothetical protein
MSSEERTQTLRWRRRKDARPAEILTAALACFAERGFAATRLNDVALRAGVTKGTLCLYFQNASRANPEVGVRNRVEEHRHTLPISATFHVR